MYIHILFSPILVIHISEIDFVTLKIEILANIFKFKCTENFCTWLFSTIHSNYNCFATICNVYFICTTIPIYMYIWGVTLKSLELFIEEHYFDITVIYQISYIYVNLFLILDKLWWLLCHIKNIIRKIIPLLKECLGNSHRK